MSETPKSSRKQRGQACERCWKRKQKCDKALPACAACVEVHAECFPRKFAIEPIASSGGNLSHSAIPSYVETLKRKRRDLEDQLGRQTRQRSCQSQGAPVGLLQTPGAASRTTETAQTHPPNNDQAMPENSVSAAMGEIGFLSRSAMAEPRDEANPFSQQLSMGRMVCAALALSGANPYQSNVDPYKQSIATLADPAVSLSRQLALPFLDYFQKTIGFQCIHISQKELRNDFDSCFSGSQTEAGRSLSNIPPHKAFAVYLYVATGILLSPESSILQGLSGSLHRSGMKIFSSILDSGNGTDILHCMIALVLFSMYSPQGGSAWHLIGLAVNKAITLGFHKEPDSKLKLPPHEIFMRRTIFWSLYEADRTISIIMDQPFNIEDEDITLMPPDEYINNSPEKNKAAYHKMTHARLMSGIRDGASNSVLYHYSNICYWKDSAQDSIADDSQAGFVQKEILRLTARAMVEILKSKGSFNIEATMIHSSQVIEKDIVATCSKYIDHEFASSDRGMFIGGFVDAYDIFAAGVAIVCLKKGDLSPSVDSSVINKCTTLLTIIGEKFTGLRILRRTLQAFADEVLTNARNDSIIHELPGIIPNGIRKIISEKLRSR